MDSGLRDKSVLVTGASGGIGQSIVRVMVEEGAKVAIHYHSGVERAQSLANSLPESQVELVGADLTSESDVAGMFDAVTIGLAKSTCWWLTQASGRKKIRRYTK